MRSAIVVVIAVLSGWLVRGVNDVESAPAPAPAPAETAVMRETAPDVIVPSVAQLQLPIDSRGERNLFAYREWPVVVSAAQPIVPQYVPPPVTVVAAVQPAVVVPQPPQFPYRFLGAFGSRQVRVAAFSRDGEIVTVRAGDRIGGFVLQSIGTESVEVRAADGSVQRVAASSPV